MNREKPSFTPAIRGRCDSLMRDPQSLRSIIPSRLMYRLRIACGPSRVTRQTPAATQSADLYTTSFGQIQLLLEGETGYFQATPQDSGGVVREIVTSERQTYANAQSTDFTSAGN